MVDRAAKNAANNTEDTILSAIPLDLHEYCLQIKKNTRKQPSQININRF